MSEDDEMPETCEDAFDRLEAEVIRLKALVEAAYFEGWNDRDLLRDRLFVVSESYKSLGGPNA